MSLKRIALLFIRLRSALNERLRLCLTDRPRLNICLLLILNALISNACSFPINYSVANGLRQSNKSTAIRETNESTRKYKQIFSEHINRTTFPSISFWLKQLSQKAHPKCSGYSLDLSMSSPQAINPELTIMQSSITIQVIANNEFKTILFTTTEILTFHSSQGVNEEILLQSVVQRLFDRVMSWCITKA